MACRRSAERPCARQYYNIIWHTQYYNYYNVAYDYAISYDFISYSKRPRARLSAPPLRRSAVLERGRLSSRRARLQTEGLESRIRIHVILGQAIANPFSSHQPCNQSGVRPQAPAGPAERDAGAGALPRPRGREDGGEVTLRLISLIILYFRLNDTN